MKNNLGFATELEIDRCQRAKSRDQSDQDEGRPGTIICQFNKFKDKQKILNNIKKLRETAIYKDFSKENAWIQKKIFGRKHCSIEDKINLSVLITEAL